MQVRIEGTGLADEIEVARQRMIGSAEQAEHGLIPAQMAAIRKVFSGELMDRLGGHCTTAWMRRVTSDRELLRHNR